MKLVSLRDLDAMRLSVEYLALRPRPPEKDDYIAITRAVVDEAITARARAPVCPFCRGAVGTTPTVGRLECVDCGAVLLQGRL